MESTEKKELKTKIIDKMVERAYVHIGESILRDREVLHFTTPVDDVVKFNVDVIVDNQERVEYRFSKIVDAIYVVESPTFSPFFVNEYFDKNVARFLGIADWCQTYDRNNCFETA